MSTSLHGRPLDGGRSPRPDLGDELGLEAHIAWLREELRRGAKIVTLPAPRVQDVVALWPDVGDALLFGRGNDDVAGVGIARLVSVAHAPRALDGLGTDHSRVPDAPPLRACGGMCFDASDADDPVWAGFGAGAFVVPRWSYGRTADGAWLRFVGTPDAPVDLDRVEQELRTLDARLRTADAHAHDAPEGIAAVVEPPRARWNEYVQSITAAIARGDVTKVVAARRVELQLARELRGGVREVLRALRDRFPGCTRFAMRRGDATFLGATPELLVTRRGREVATEALAGSAGHGEGLRLLQSAKDGHEHSLVVDAIRQALEPMVDIEDHGVPTLRELPNVVHLHTPLRGELRDSSVHVMELVHALHPTPAVGGVPRAAALRWILEAERAHYGARGWYAAPFGVFDARGDGEFVVALRSGLLLPDRAYAFAGCGIVGESEADAEHAESALKLRPIIDALGGVRE